MRIAQYIFPSHHQPHRSSTCQQDDSHILARLFHFYKKILHTPLDFFPKNLITMIPFTISPHLDTQSTQTAHLRRAMPSFAIFRTTGMRRGVPLLIHGYPISPRCGDQSSCITFSKYSLLSFSLDLKTVTRVVFHLALPYAIGGLLASVQTHTNIKTQKTKK